MFFTTRRRSDAVEDDERFGDAFYCIPHPPFPFLDESSRVLTLYDNIETEDMLDLHLLNNPYPSLSLLREGTIKCQPSNS